VPAPAVREILSLPELTPVEEAPEYVAGVMNLRGRIVPVIDLMVRFGHARQPYRLADSVVVFEWEGTAMGLILNAVRDVWEIPESAIEAVPQYAPGQPARFLAGFAKRDEQVIMLLDLERVVRLPVEVPAQLEEGEGEESPPAPERVFAPEATAEERETFRERARSLARPVETRDFTGLQPLAVARLGTELFGFPLPAVREFSDLTTVTRVPCCPDHVVGQMNLRGDILTLVDIRSALRIANGRPVDGKVVVVQSGDLVVGIPVDEVLDVLYLRPAEITGVPAVLEAAEGQYLEGTAPYGSQMLGILDLQRLLTGANLVVNEEP